MRVEEKKIEQFDEKFMSYVIDRVIPFPVILEKAGYENYDYQGNQYCPFHPNEDTPAAKLFKDGDGDRLWCFGECHRMYRPSDVIKYKLIKSRLASVFTKVWSQLGDNTKTLLKDDFGQPKEFLTDEFKEVIIEMERFKRGYINLDDYLNLVIKAVDTI